VLERAFQDTYGIPLTDVLTKEDLAIGTFRRAIGNILPEMTAVALIARRQEIVSETPNFKARQFRYYLSRTSYQKEWVRAIASRASGPDCGVLSKILFPD